MKAIIFKTCRGAGRRPAVLLLAVLALALVSPPAALAGNPAEELFKLGGATNGLDAAGDSWQAIQRSVDQFSRPEFMLRLLLGFTLAVACSWLVAWHPRRSSRIDALSDLEERKTLILLGLVGAIVAELSGRSATLAFVIFGIGSLLRFRTVLDNPKLTGKAIIVVVIGLACGMGYWTLAVFVTVFSWFLIFWLDAHVACRLRIRLDDEDMDPKLVFGMLQTLLIARRCRLRSSSLYKGKRQMVFLMHMPADLDLKKLEQDIRNKLPQPDDARIDITVV